MLIERTNPITGRSTTMELDITPQELDAYNRGAYAQDAFPRLNPDQREFFMTGLLPDDWERIFGPE